MIITKPIAQALFEQSDNDSSVIFYNSYFASSIYSQLI